MLIVHRKDILNNFYSDNFAERSKLSIVYCPFDYNPPTTNIPPNYIPQLILSPQILSPPTNYIPTNYFPPVTPAKQILSPDILSPYPPIKPFHLQHYYH